MRVSVWITSLGLGDTICATPAIRRLRTRMPGRAIDVFTYYPEIFLHNRAVDAVHGFREDLELSGEYGRLRREKYSHSFLTFFSSEHKPDIDYYGNTIPDVCSLIMFGERLPPREQWLEVPASEEEARSLLDKTAEYGIDFTRAVAIHPSITWPTRTWPPRNWQKLVDRLSAAGFQVLAVGSSQPVIERRSQVEAIDIHPCPRGAIDLVDKLNILETITLLSRCRAVVTTDSGLLHMALATDTPIVGIFTIVSPRYRLAWRRHGVYHNVTVVPPPGSCNYCANRPNAAGRDFRTCPLGDPPPCMPDADTTFQSFEDLLARRSRQPIRGVPVSRCTAQPLAGAAEMIDGGSWMLAGANPRSELSNILSPSNIQHPTSSRKTTKLEDGRMNDQCKPPPTFAEGEEMQQQSINPDVVCQQAIQAKLNVYQAKEQFETIIKTYNDQVDNLITVVNLMKNRILELEAGPSPRPSPSEG